MSAIALSALGLFVAIFGLAMVKGLAAGAILLVWLSAMVALARMAIAWTHDTRLGRSYSRHAFLLGVASLLSLPLAMLAESPTSSHTVASLLSATSMLLFEIVIASPAIALAWHLNRFHSDRQSWQIQ